MEASGTIMLTARKADPSWNVFGAELQRLIADPPKEALVIRAELLGNGSNPTCLTVAFKLEECIVVEDGFIILSVLNLPKVGVEVKSVDDSLEQIVWRKNMAESGDEIAVEALSILVL